MTRVAVTSPPNSLSKCGTMMSQPVRAAGGTQADSESWSNADCDRQMREHRGDGERDEQPESADRLRPVLAPGHPCHRSGTLSIGRALGMRSGAM